MTDRNNTPNDEPAILSAAIAFWEMGHDINLIHEIKLMEMGFDVQALREQHWGTDKSE